MGRGGGGRMGGGLHFLSPTMSKVHKEYDLKDDEEETSKHTKDHTC